MKPKLITTIAATALTATMAASIKPADAAQLNLAGNVNFTASTIAFSSLSAPPVPSTLNVGVSTDIFAPFIGTLAGVQTLVAPAGNAPLNLPNFVTLTSGSNQLFFDLVGFTQSNIGQPVNSVITATVQGTFHNADNTISIPGSGIFTTQSTSPSTISASFITTVPEPSDVAGITTLGAVGGMFVLRNRKQLKSTVKS